MTDPNPLQTVIRYEAENFIDEKNYVAAAELLALSADTFESLVLKFLRPAKSSRNGLKRFLELKLNQLISNATPQSNEEKIRRDLLVLWLLEIQLGELAELRKQTMNTRGVMPSLSEKMTDSGSAGYATPEPDALTRLLRRPDDIKKIREELYCFFNRAPVFECISENRDVIYGLCSAHVDFETQMHLAQKLKDSEMIIRILLHQKQFFEALDVLNSQHCEPQLFYRYSPELISEIPSELVDSFLKKEKLINPVLLLPTFYKFLDPTVKRHPKELAATFQYFDRILLCASIQQIDQKILNFIIQLYANFRPNALLDCFKRIIQRFRLDPMNPAHCFNLVLPFDIEQALRICIEKGLKKCSVFLYALENRYDDAIKLALTEDLELAKQYALELNQKFQRYSSAANQISIDMHADEASKDQTLEAHNSLNPFDEISKENETDNLFDNLLDTSFDLMLLQKLGEMKKRVWIEIVKHVVLRAIGKKEIQDSLILLRDSQGTIDIRDILQFYPDLTTIEHFKEPICECLREHSQEIQAIQKETVEVSKMASELRADIEHANSNHMVVKSSDRCAKCREVLLTRSFLAFCCRHFFHRDCLEKHMLNVIFSSEERLEYHNALAEQRALKRQREVATASLTKRKDPNPSAINKKRAPMNDILRLLADDCPFCGHRAIEAISQPFYSMEEYEAELKLWI